jgi:hypothetical protein
VLKTSSKEFNWKIFALLDTVKDMEYKDKMTDSGKMSQDPLYQTLGPLALIATIQQADSCLLSSKIGLPLFQFSLRAIMCLHILLQRAPLQYTVPLPYLFLGNAIGGGRTSCARLSKNLDKPGSCKQKTDSTPRQDRLVLKDRAALPAWRYAEPKDLNTTIVEDGRAWKFCTKCTCKRLGKVGCYNLSHFDWEHANNPLPSNKNEVSAQLNLASVRVPVTVPEATRKLTLPPEDNDVEFQGLGAWCVEIDSPDFPLVNMVDCSVDPPTEQNSLSPLAFFTLKLSSLPIRYPVIFNTGASLAITPDKSNFTGLLSIPTGNLRLGGMANGLIIEGIGTITWNFQHTDGSNVALTGSAYYVPGAKARLLSPQHLFDDNKMNGYYKGDKHALQLYIQDKQVLTIEYNQHNSLSIGYAWFGLSAVCEANIAILDEANQNLTIGQKLLLHWHYRFGHLNLPAVQQILHNVPFLSGPFPAAAKCETRSIQCAICEYAKGHCCSIASTTTVTCHPRTLKVIHLSPGLQVSVNHFESRLPGHTFNSYGRVSSSTYKGVDSPPNPDFSHL